MKRNRYIFFSLFICCIFFLFTNSVSADTREALGWGWIGTSSGTYATPGLISFNCENHGGCSGYDYHVDVDYTEGGLGNLMGWAWIGAVSPYGAYTTGWIKFSDDPSGYLNVDEDYPFEGITGANYDDATGEVSGWARIMTLSEYGEEYGWVKLRGTWGGGTGSYGVTFDKDYYEDGIHGKFADWAWSGDSPTGLGWLQFDLGATMGNAWLQTEYGDIYSNHGFNLTPPPSSFYNATYLILSNGSITATTASGFSPLENVDLYFPEENDNGVYRSNIGKIDLRNLNAQATEISDLSIFNSALNGTIYKTNELSGNLTIDEPLVIQNGNSGTFGNGTIIVNGDLEINENIYNLDTNISDIRELPSVAWIVTGNLTINPYVTNLAGVFIVLGETGVDTGEGSQGLEVQGLMMAKQYNFGRTKTREGGTDVPSEKITYDGRALANTPPGLEDLIATLPELGIEQ